MEDDKIKNLFIEAASESIPITKNQEEVFRETQILKAELIVEENKNKWDLVSEKMTGEYAERFMQEMDALSGREFIRVYTKMIEYFKPKVIRVEAKEREEEDNIIRIEIHNSVPQKKQEDDTIDIEHKEE
jgi:hypothetical protein